jgi:hypothetical protein
MVLQFGFLVCFVRVLSISFSLAFLVVSKCLKSHDLCSFHIAESFVAGGIFKFKSGARRRSAKEYYAYS